MGERACNSRNGAGACCELPYNHGSPCVFAPLQPAPTTGAEAREPEDREETQRESAQRIAEEHLSGLEAHFRAQGALPSRDVRLLLDLVRILSDPPAAAAVPAREPSDTARHFRVIEKALGYVMPYFAASRKDAEASLAALRASLPETKEGT